MPASALALALAAAVLHALWNLLLAREQDVRAATSVAIAVAVVAFAPAAALTWDVSGRAVPFIAATAALELVYFFLLSVAYVRAEVSVVYPLSRGLAPVLVLGAGAVTLGRPSGGELAGVLLVAAGVLLVRGLRRGRGAGWGIAIAAVIAGYTLVDDRGIEHAAALPYLELSLIPVAAAGLLSVGAKRARAALTPAAAAAGLASFGAYALVLLALDLAPAAPVAAVREASVVVAAALAIPLLRERVGPARLAGACLVAGGVALLGVAA